MTDDEAHRTPGAGGSLCLICFLLSAVILVFIFWYTHRFPLRGLCTLYLWGKEPVPLAATQTDLPFLLSFSPETLDVLSADNVPFSVQFSMFTFLLWFMFEFLLNQIIAFPWWDMPYDNLVRTKSSQKSALSALSLIPPQIFPFVWTYSVSCLSNSDPLQHLGRFSDMSLRKDKHGLVEIVLVERKSLFQNYFTIQMTISSQHIWVDGNETDWMATQSHSRSQWRQFWHSVPVDDSVLK